MHRAVGIALLAAGCGRGVEKRHDASAAAAPPPADAAPVAIALDAGDGHPPCPAGTERRISPDGTTLVRCLRPDGTEHGPQLTFWPDGKTKQSLVHVTEGEWDGTLTRWDPEGRLQSEEQYAMGRPTGIHTRYHEGVIRMRLHHDDAGKIVRFEEFRGGQPVALPVCPEGTQRKEAWDLVRKDGPFEETYGRIWCELRGKPHGPFAEYRDDRSTYREGAYERGKEHGFERRFHANDGDLIEEGPIEDGRRAGVWTHWDLYGTYVHHRTLYDAKGQPSREINYNPDGSVSHVFAFENGEVVGEDPDWRPPEPK